MSEFYDESHYMADVDRLHNGCGGCLKKTSKGTSPFVHAYFIWLIHHHQPHWDATFSLIEASALIFPVNSRPYWSVWRRLNALFKGEPAEMKARSRTFAMSQIAKRLFEHQAPVADGVVLEGFSSLNQKRIAKALTIVFDPTRNFHHWLHPRLSQMALTLYKKNPKPNTNDLSELIAQFHGVSKPEEKKETRKVFSLFAERKFPVFFNFWRK